MKCLEIIDSINNFASTGSEANAGAAHHDALLVSPFDMRVYILRLPPLKQRQYADAISYQLRALYPGNPDDTACDYTLFREKNLTRVVAFVADQAILAAYTQKNRPLIPGLALMERAIHQKREPTTQRAKKLALLCTPAYLEAALYEGNALLQYASCRADDAATLIIRMVAAAGEESPIIGMSRAEDRGIFERYTALFPAHPQKHIALETLSKGVKASRVALFVNPAPYKARHRAFVAALVMANTCALFFSFHLLAKDVAVKKSEIKHIYEAQKARSTEVQTLEAEIATLTQDTGAVRNRIAMYHALAVIHEALEGAWIRSISIRDNSFTFEAEGTDSVRVLQALNHAPFSDVTLQQARPSQTSALTERFSISGIIHHD